jgi:hypothetical protein
MVRMLSTRLGRREVLLMVVFALAFSTPWWIVYTCPVQYALIGDEERALIALKNRTQQPTGSDFEPRVTLEALLARGDDRARWSEQRAAAIEGHVVAVQPGAIEFANCLSFTDRDTHIDIALVPDAPPTERVVLEVTPPMREWARQRGLDWSLPALRALVGHRARIEGWLLWDLEHVDESENTNPTNSGNWRRTAWELHPVTAIHPLE